MLSEVSITAPNGCRLRQPRYTNNSLIVDMPVMEEDDHVYLRRMLGRHLSDQVARPKQTILRR